MTTLITKLVVRLTYRTRVQERLVRVCQPNPELEARIARAQMARRARKWDATWAGHN